MIISYRIHLDHYLREDRLDLLLAFLQRHAPAVDEISLFTEGAHGYHALEFLQALAPRLERALRRLQACGWRAGINVLNTIGHLDEAPERLYQVPWQPLVGSDGTVTRAQSCPLDPAFLADVAARYLLMAELRPDFIWVDDDLRLSNHAPADHGCYCPLCLADFSERTGRDWTRPTLLAALQEEPWPALNPVRVAWEQAGHEKLQALLRVIERAAHAVDPGLELGLMQGSPAHIGEWLQTLAGPISGGTGVSPVSAARENPGEHRRDAGATQTTPVRYRPGGGFYADDRPGELFEKAHGIGQQVAYSHPERLASIQSEIENFPYHLLRKSVHLNMTEAACYLATGCDGIAWNLLPDGPNPFDDYEARLTAIERWRPFFETLTAWAGDHPSRGLWLAADPLYESRGWYGGKFPQGVPDTQGAAQKALRELGFPPAFRPEHAAVTVLAGNAVTAFSEPRLREILAGSVIVDAPAAQWLEKLGLADLVGVRAEAITPGGLRERLTADPLNGSYAGQYRNAWLGFYPNPAHRLEPLAEGVRGLAEHVAYYAEDWYPPHPPTDPSSAALGWSVTAYENALGGRVAVLGYCPWERAHNSAKRVQLLALAQWASGDRLPVSTDKCHPVALYARGSADGASLCVTVVNASADPTGPLPLRLTTPGTRAQLMRPGDTAPRSVPLQRDGETHAVVTVDGLAPWEMCAVRVGD